MSSNRTCECFTVLGDNDVLKFRHDDTLQSFVMEQSSGVGKLSIFPNSVDPRLVLGSQNAKVSYIDASNNADLRLQDGPESTGKTVIGKGGLHPSTFSSIGSSKSPFSEVHANVFFGDGSNLTGISGSGFPKFTYLEDMEFNMTTSTEPVLVDKLDLAKLVKGNYLLQWNYDWKYAGKLSGIEVSIMTDKEVVDNYKNVANSSTIHECSDRISGFRQMSWVEVPKNIFVMYNAVERGTAYISNIKICLFRIS